MAATGFKPARLGAVLRAEGSDAGLCITDQRNNRRLVLGPAESVLWGYLDGTRSVAEIAGALSAELGTRVEAEEVWRSLDGLSDLGLLESRLTPPAGDSPVGRRRFLHLGSALLAGSAAALTPSLAMAFCDYVDPSVPSEALDKEMQCKSDESEVLGKQSEQAEKSVEEAQKGEMNRKGAESASKEMVNKGEQDEKAIQAEINDKEYFGKTAAELEDKARHAEYVDKVNAGEMQAKESAGKYYPPGCTIDCVPVPVPVIPEPATIALFGAGIAVVAGAVWRRRKAEQDQAGVEPPMPADEDEGQA